MHKVAALSFLRILFILQILSKNSSRSWEAGSICAIIRTIVLLCWIQAPFPAIYGIFTGADSPQT